MLYAVLPAVKGLFTSVDPNSRRVVPENADGRVKVKVVYVVLESQYQAALTAAVKSLNAKNSKVCFEIVGYLLEELRDEKNFEAFKEDLATTNIFVGSLIFIEELAEKVCSSNAPGVHIMEDTQTLPVAISWPGWSHRAMYHKRKACCSTFPLFHWTVTSMDACNGFVGTSGRSCRDASAAESPT